MVSRSIMKQKRLHNFEFVIFPSCGLLLTWNYKSIYILYIFFVWVHFSYSYVYILIYQFEYVYILILWYSKSYYVKFFQNNPYFLICYSNTMTVVYKISITIYSMYTCIFDIRTTIDGLIWSYTSSTYTLSGHIHLKSKDIHMGVGVTTPWE